MHDPQSFENARRQFLLKLGAGLGWLSAAAIPLLIHLWNKRKYREVSWAAVQFLMAAMRRNSRRIQIQQWLLLAVRTLLILLVVFAVAEPFLERVGLNFVAGQRTHKVLVIDGSYSMAYRPTDSSRFTRAKQLATQIVDRANQQYNQIVDKAKSDAVAEGARQKAVAQAEIESLSHQAREILRQQVASLAVSGAEKILKREIDQARHRDLLDALAKEI